MRTKTITLKTPLLTHLTGSDLWAVGPNPRVPAPGGLQGHERVPMELPDETDLRALRLHLVKGKRAHHTNRKGDLRSGWFHLSTDEAKAIVDALRNGTPLPALRDAEDIAEGQREHQANWRWSSMSESQREQAGGYEAYMAEVCTMGGAL